MKTFFLFYTSVMSLVWFLVALWMTWFYAKDASYGLVALLWFLTAVPWLLGWLTRKAFDGYVRRYRQDDKDGHG